MEIVWELPCFCSDLENTGRSFVHHTNLQQRHSMRRSSSPKLLPILQIGAMQERHRRFSEVGLKVPLMVRLEGTKVELGRDIIRNSGLNVIAADDLSDAAEKVVKAVRG